DDDALIAVGDFDESRVGLERTRDVQAPAEFDQGDAIADIYDVPVHTSPQCLSLPNGRKPAARSPSDGLWPDCNAHVTVTFGQFPPPPPMDSPMSHAMAWTAGIGGNMRDTFIDFNLLRKAADRSVPVKAGQVIFAAGDEANDFYVVESGTVAIRLGNRTLDRL